METQGPQKGQSKLTTKILRILGMPPMRQGPSTHGSRLVPVKMDRSPGPVASRGSVETDHHFVEPSHIVAAGCTNAISQLEFLSCSNGAATGSDGPGYYPFQTGTPLSYGSTQTRAGESLALLTPGATVQAAPSCMEVTFTSMGDGKTIVQPMVGSRLEVAEHEIFMSSSELALREHGTADSPQTTVATSNDHHGAEDNEQSTLSMTDYFSRRFAPLFPGLNESGKHVPTLDFNDGEPANGLSVSEGKLLRP